MSKYFYVKYPLFLWEFNVTRVFSTDVRKKLKYHVSSKYVQWESSCSIPTEKTENRAHMTGLRFVFRGFANLPKTFVKDRNTYRLVAEDLSLCV